MFVSELPDFKSDRNDFDLVIVGLGYERRARHCVHGLGIRSDRGAALTFGYGEELSFTENKSYFSEKGFEIIPGNAEDTQQALERMLETVLHGRTTASRICVDISVMSRQMMAYVLLALWECAKTKPIEIYCCYAPSAYLSPPEPSPLRRSEPVTSEFSGWTAKPDSPLNCIIGLGYEKGLAIGALQFLDPAKVWAFIPNGQDGRYLQDVNDVNQLVFDHFNVARLEYSVSDPHRLRRILIEVTRNLIPRCRFVFIPFGPKIFSWISMLVALELKMRDVSVWRFSAQEATVPIDRSAAGLIVQANFLLSATP